MKLKYVLMEKVSLIIQRFRYAKLYMLGYKNISRKAILESGLNLDRVHPRGIYIGENTLIASMTTILCHEHVKRDPNNERNPWITNTCIGKNTFIGVGTIILPGVQIGDEVIIGAGSVVTKSIPSYSVAVGNPAKVIRNNIKMNKKAVLIS
jgi:acetyltransferase-like isoleucine patch superfamily enzyme